MVDSVELRRTDLDETRRQLEEARLRCIALGVVTVSPWVRVLAKRQNRALHRRRHLVGPKLAFMDVALKMHVQRHMYHLVRKSPRRLTHPALFRVASDAAFCMD